jgi:hypothetical protein
MKKLMLILTLMLAFVSVSMAQDPGWPRQKASSAGRLVYYQPQVDSWNNYRDVQFRMAFSLTPTGGKQVVGRRSDKEQHRYQHRCSNCATQ